VCLRGSPCCPLSYFLPIPLSLAMTLLSSVYSYTLNLDWLLLDIQYYHRQKVKHYVIFHTHLLTVRQRHIVAGLQESQSLCKHLKPLYHSQKLLQSPCIICSTLKETWFHPFFSGINSPISTSSGIIQSYFTYPAQPLPNTYALWPA
jgi:hypothetical protein